MRIGAFQPSKVYGTCLICLFFVCSFVSVSSAVTVEERYLGTLLASAHQRHLSEDSTWEALLHYKPAGSGKESLMDDPRFFLARNGKVNPSAELDATIAAFFTEQKKDIEHPRCRFAARYAWLKEQLTIDETRLPAADCSEFNQAMTRVDANSAVLVFPASHINSPASMFGHTLIRVDSENLNPLLSYAVTYAANATDSNGLLYAFKGIFGYYRGYFSIHPYYDKVAEYNNMEHRDIWEYRLNLTREEVTRMVMHVWEIRDMYARYYFFDENCSFDLLLLLETARPSLHLSDEIRSRLHFWVIPVDTIRAIKQAGLVTSETYRPSISTRIEAISATMNGVERKKALNLAKGTTSPREILESSAKSETKMNILDLSAELLQFRYARKEIDKENYLKLFLPDLQARSALGARGTDGYALAPPLSPEQGHLPARFGLGAGYRTDSSFLELGWRAAYHDLLDDDGGYVEGAQINFMNLRARYFLQENSLRLWQLHVIDIVSLAPRNIFFSPVSWKVNTGFDREVLADGEDHLVYRLNPGGGFSARNEAVGLVYAMIESDLELSGAYHRNYSLGFGPSVGFIKTIGDAWKVSLSGTEIFYEAGDEHRSIKVSLLQNFRINSNDSISLFLTREKTFDYFRTDAMLGWNIYMR